MTSHVVDMSDVTAPVSPAGYFPPQRRAVFCDETTTVIDAPVRTGKTVAASRNTARRITLDYAEPELDEGVHEGPVRYWLCAPHYQQNKDQKIAFNKFIRRNPFLIDRKKQGDSELWANEAKGGGYLWLVKNRLVEYISCHNEDNIIAAKVRGFWLTEGARISETAFGMLTQRQSNYRKPWRVIDTVAYGKGWFWKQLVDPMRRGVYPGGGIHEWTCEDSPHVNPEEVERQRRTLPGWMFRRDYLNTWETFDGQVYSNFADERNIASRDTSDARVWRRFVAADLNATEQNPACWLTVYVNVYTGEIHVANEHEQFVGIEFGRYVEALASTAAGQPAATLVLDPSIPREIKRRLRGKRLSVHDGPNDVDEGIRCVAELVGTGRLTVDARCVGLLDEFAQYRWKMDRTGAVLNVPDKRAFDAHRLDALRYLCMWAKAYMPARKFVPGYETVFKGAA